jgi:hypothetical protein
MYTDNADGTVTDAVTGLIWQQSLAPGTFTLSNAVAYCPTLKLAGHSGWRLPNFIELASIVDYGQVDPVVNVRYFPTMPSPSYLWSSSLIPPSSAWVIRFANMSHLPNGMTNALDVSSMNGVRCVRSAVGAVDSAKSAPAGRYTTASGTVSDIKTKLTWQQMAPAAAFTLTDAKTYCELTAGMSLAGTGWRLPTVKELLTILDYSHSSAPFIDRSAFPSTPSAPFLSSTPTAGRWAGAAWWVGFDGSGAQGTGGANLVRCVR